MLNFDLKLEAKYSDDNFKNYSVDFDFDQDYLLSSDDIIDEMEEELEIDIEEIGNVQFNIIECSLPLEIEDEYNAESYDDIVERLRDILRYDEEQLLKEYYEYNPDELIYPLCDLDDMLYRKLPSEIVEMVVNGDYSSNDGYFTLDANENLISLNNHEKVALEQEHIKEMMKQRF